MEAFFDFPTCRLCLMRSPYAVGLYDEMGRHGYIAAHAIEELLCFRVTRYDGYPQTVCPDCLDKLTDFKVFKEQCLESKLAFDKSLLYEKYKVVVETIKAEPVDDEIEEIMTPSEEPEPENINESQVNQEEIVNEEVILKDEMTELDEGSDEELKDDKTQVSTVVEKSDPKMVQASETWHPPPTTPEEQPFLAYQLRASLRNVMAGKLKKTKRRFKRNQNGRHKCSICLKTFAQKSYLNAHYAAHNMNHKYECRVCQRGFNCKSSMEMHLRIHLGVNPFVCDVCGKGFNQKGNLQSHRRIHTGEKPFVCDVCQRAFTHGSSLKSHEKIHLPGRKRKKYSRRGDNNNNNNNKEVGAKQQ